MECLPTTPGLPDTTVSSVLVSSEFPEIISALKQLGIYTLEVSPNPNLDASVCSHPDCVYFQLNNNTVFTDRSLYNDIVNFLTIRNIISEISINLIGESVMSPYPDDVKLNCIRISDNIICNTKHVSRALKHTANLLKLNLTHVNQGYAACSTVLINDQALITDDVSIHKTVTGLGIDSLLVSKGSVQLKNQTYGFIGGTCGMIGKNRIAFSGDIKSHSDYNSIISFLTKYDIDYICLTDAPLIDIGGIIPLTQKT